MVVAGGDPVVERTNGSPNEPKLALGDSVPEVHEDSVVEHKLARTEGTLADSDASAFQGAPDYFMSKLQMGDQPMDHDGLNFPGLIAARRPPGPAGQGLYPDLPGLPTIVEDVRDKRPREEVDDDQEPPPKASKARGGARKKSRKHSRRGKRQTRRGKKPRRKTRARKHSKNARSRRR